MQFELKDMKKIAALLLAGALLTSCGLHKKKYANPITKDTMQPDKVLFDRAINDIEHGRYEVARLTLNTLINTYDSSEYLAKAKLAIADSWYREGGSHGLAQAEAEYKDFILFYPQMEEAAESQWKVCEIHYKQMEKADRDSAQAQRTEDECRALVTQFPNSKYLAQAQQMLRNVQEVLGEKEFRTGAFYHNKGSYPAAANRLTYVADQYPLYSGADQALWEAADSFMKMGDRFENQAADDYTRIVRDYPLSHYAGAAKDKLEEMKRPVPAADPNAVARMKYEQDHRTKEGTMTKAMDIFRHGPDTHQAAKEGAPAMTAMRPPTPVSVPQVAATPTSGTVTGGATTSDVTAGVISDTGSIDKQPDARQNLANAPAAGAAANGNGTGAASDKPAAGGDKPAGQEPVQQALPTNHAAPKKTKKQLKQEEEYRKKQAAALAKQQANAPKDQDQKQQPDQKPDQKPQQ